MKAALPELRSPFDQANWDQVLQYSNAIFHRLS